MAIRSELRPRYESMVHAMRSRGGLLVAFSGGVDSGLVAKVAVDTLGPRAAAVLADSESLARRELREAEAFAAEIGIPLRVVQLSELSNPDYAANPTNRCYFCRSELGVALGRIALGEGFPAIADGVHVSDLGDVRPGIRAMDEAGFWHPLVECGFGKPEVRAVALDLGLSIADKPSNACLSSRIPHGIPVTVALLRQVEAAEEVLRDRGFRQVRVRHVGGTARIEVLPEDISRLEAMETEVAAAIRGVGYTAIVIDPRGYRTERATSALTSFPGRSDLS